MRLYFCCKIVYLVNYVFSVPGIKEKRIVLLSRNLCQDPLENYFGCQRQCGGTSDNPNALEYGKNTEALRVVKHTVHAVDQYAVTVEVQVQRNLPV